MHQLFNTCPLQNLLINFLSLCRTACLDIVGTEGAYLEDMIRLLMKHSRLILCQIEFNVSCMSTIVVDLMQAQLFWLFASFALMKRNSISII